MGLIAAGAEASLIDRPGGIFVRRGEQIVGGGPDADADRGARDPQRHARARWPSRSSARPRAEAAVAALRAARRAPRREPPVAVEVAAAATWSLFNGLGGFTPRRPRVRHHDRRRARRRRRRGSTCSPTRGSARVVTESGGAYTWCENAHELPAHAVAQRPGQRRERRSVLPARRGDRPLLVADAAAGARADAVRRPATASATASSSTPRTASPPSCASTSRLDAPVKFVVAQAAQPLRPAAPAVGHRLLSNGARRHCATKSPCTSSPRSTRDRRAVRAQRLQQRVRRPRRLLRRAASRTRTVTGDRTEFLGRNGTPARPGGACAARGCPAASARGSIPCAAMQVPVELADGQEREIVVHVRLGPRPGATRAHLVAPLPRHRRRRAARSKASGRYWNRTLGAVHVETPDPSLNFLANGWLLYQTLACRIWARSGFYQSGGAFGFRDQLQDAMALRPRRAGAAARAAAARRRPPVPRGRRAALVASAAGPRRAHAHSPTTTSGCRTPPAATSRATGDTGVLDETRAVPRRPAGQARRGERTTTCRRAPTSRRRSTSTASARSSNGLRFGAHGLPLMGCGDWNDGMNLVGEHGKGESVWLAFFLYDVLDAVRRRSRGGAATSAFADALRGRGRAACARTSSEHAWDGEWYRRAYFDDGTPLGSATQRRVPDRLAPAELGGAVRRRRSASASRRRMAAVDRAPRPARRRADPAARPAVRQVATSNPGYIKGYVPGVRENGGQYTHAAIWAVDGVRRAGRCRTRVGAVPADQPGPPRRHRRGDRHLQGRALRRRRRRLHQRRSMPAAAAGPGTPARPAGCTG